MAELERRELEELFILHKHCSKNGRKISCSIQNWLITFRIVKITTFVVIGFFPTKQKLFASKSDTNAQINM